ncbi:hypothetical protein MMC10_003537 [Thelotrema lepadinum]|nr:hypothetical protein [Thelotrema lepadinum]
MALGRYVCIDKTNSVETARAINSMFDWYRTADVCYAYLDDVAHVPSVPGRYVFRRQKQRDQESEWFERGWTLQELLAPDEKMEFYEADWKRIGTKQELSGTLEKITGIDKKYLTGDADFRDASVATRMSWMAGRFTTQVEDVAYSMLGLFDINMTIQYSEGVKAFMGLQKALMEGSTDESIFAWTVPAKGLRCYRNSKPVQKWQNWAEKEWGVLAPSPDCFERSGDLVLPPPDKTVLRPGGGYTWTQQGVLFNMPIKSEANNMFGVMRKDITLPLNCWRPAADGKPETVRIKLLKRNDGYKRVQLDGLDLKKGAKPSANTSMKIDQVLTRPLIITQPVFRL